VFRSGVALATTALTLAATGLGASADTGANPAPQAACEPAVFYIIDHQTDYFFGIGPTYKDGPGGEMSFTNTFSGTASASMTVGAEAEIGAVISKAKASVSATLTASVEIGTGHTFTHEIADNKYGNAQYGAWGKTLEWHREQDLANCTTKVLSSGTAIVPSLKIGWKFWETKS
jgi:hypothetical protein